MACSTGSSARLTFRPAVSFEVTARRVASAKMCGTASVEMGSAGGSRWIVRLGECSAHRDGGACVQVSTHLQAGTDMSDAHALLQAAWETGDLLPLLALADLLDESDGHDTADLIRLTAAEASTARHSADRARRLKRLRGEAWKSVTSTSWPEVAVQPDTSAAGFSRRADPLYPIRETIVVRPEWRTIHWLRGALNGTDEVISSRTGLELLRRESPPATIDFIRRRWDLWGASLGFTIEEDYFPLLAGWQANAGPALSDRRRRMETALLPALVMVADLPLEIVPFMAWVLTEYLTSRLRRTRGGELVPGAHIFTFRLPSGWRHAAAVENRDSGKAVTLLRRRLRWERNRGVLAALLVRVSDDHSVTARKLVWHLAAGERETANLPISTATLSEPEFRRVAEELHLGADAAAGFVAATPDRLLGLLTTHS